MAHTCSRVCRSSSSVAWRVLCVGRVSNTNGRAVPLFDKKKGFFGLSPGLDLPLQLLSVLPANILSI